MISDSREGAVSVSLIESRDSGESCIDRAPPLDECSSALKIDYRGRSAVCLGLGRSDVCLGRSAACLGRPVSVVSH